MAENEGGEKPSLRERWRDIGADQFREDMERRQRQARSRPKVSSEDMERLWQQRREQFSAAASRHPINLGLTLRIGIGALGLIGAALLTSGVNATLVESEAAAIAHASDLAFLEQEIASLEIAEDDSIVALEPVLEDYLAEAISAGEEVAALQNEFAEILVAANDEERLDEIGPYPAEIAAAAHREQLSSLWAEQSLLVESDEAAYGVNQFDPFPGSEMDPRYAWYSKMEEPRGSDYASPDDYSWSMVAAMPGFRASPETIEVTWLNRRDDGWLLAWATATYNAEHDVFSDLEVGRTSTGVEYQHGGANHDYDDSFSDLDTVDPEDFVPLEVEDDSDDEGQQS